MRIVIKFGISSLTNGNEHISPPFLIDLVRQVQQLQTAENELVQVSFGAITAGREKLNFPQLRKDIPAKQMLSAVGQPRLMRKF